MNIAESISGGPAGASPVDGVNENGTHALNLTLQIVDPDVLTEIQRIPVEAERERFALAALRVGVLALRAASGEIDAAAVKEAGAKMIADLREELNRHSAQMNGEIKSFLGAYFDPKTGLVQQRIENLVKPDGDLSRILLAHLGPDDSVMTRALAEQLGENSPLFKMLSPTEKNGLIATLQEYISEAHEKQRQAILGQFSLDNKDSALSRFLELLVGKNGEFTSTLKERIDAVVDEFSLNKPDSALSRLVKGIDDAQMKISSEFSLDNKDSGLNKLMAMLSETNNAIESSLNLNDKDSALSRLRGEMLDAVEKIANGNTAFHTEMREAIAELRARKKEAERSTTHGITFEDQLGQVLSALAQSVGDVWAATGNTTGAIQYNKKGDFVITLGPESHAPGQKVVWEAKEDRSYNLAAALSEIAEARKNREAEIGVFVFSSKTAPEGLEPFGRYGTDFVVVWDAEDPASDLLVKATYSVGRCLATRKAAVSQETEKALSEITEAARAIEKQVKYLEDFRKKGEIIKNHGLDIANRADSMADDLKRQVARLDKMVEALRAAPADG